VINGRVEEVIVQKEPAAPVYCEHSFVMCRSWRSPSSLSFENAHTNVPLVLSTRANAHAVTAFCSRTLMRLRNLNSSSLPVRKSCLVYTVIRRILVDHGRGRGSTKRGGDVHRVPLNDALVPTDGRGFDLLLEALLSLAKTDARKARVVECRYFGGLTIEETAQALGISPETAKRDWRMAKAWLFDALAGQ
jgi:RNA polymerase sigma factor (TIGR02999 family)